MAKGRVFLIETMGLVDGPGIRVVVFLQGCALRCAFCHNPESHAPSGGEEVDSNQVVNKILRFRPYFSRSGGGVTFSGGEPLLQPEFLIDCLKLCKEEGIHTCIDTAGVGEEEYFDEILSLTDLVLYDVKAVDKDAYKELTGGDISRTEGFQSALKRAKTQVIVRQVVMPGVNDTDEYMTELKQYITKNVPGAVKVELLPYHTLGEHKYKDKKREYRLAGMPAMDEKKAARLWQKYFEKSEDDK